MKKDQLKAIAMSMPDMKPRFSLDTSDLKDIKNWKVGKEYDLEMKVKMVGAHAADEEGNRDFTGEFEVLEVEGDDE